MTDDDHIKRLEETVNRLNLYLEFAADDGLDVQVTTVWFDNPSRIARWRALSIDVKRLAPYERREPYEIRQFT